MAVARLQVAAHSPLSAAVSSPLPRTPPHSLMVPTTLRRCVRAAGVNCHLVKGVHSTAHCGAGHNRWSKIHRKKAVADQERSLAITKHSAKMKSAIQTGGSADPETNFRLASLIAQSRDLGMTKSQVESVLKAKKASEHVLFEARAQSGYLLLIDTLTTGKVQCRNDMKRILNKNGGALGEPGSSLFNFHHKGIVRVPQKELQSSNTDSDELAIEVGAEEVVLEEDEPTEDGTKSGKDDEEKCYQFICAPKDLSLVAGAIKGRSFTVLSASLDYTPKTLVKLNRNQYEKAEHLIGLLEAHEDVIDIFDNFILEEQ